MRQDVAPDAKRVLIIGAGGLAREVAEAISASRCAGTPIQCEGMFVEPGYLPPNNMAYPIFTEWSEVFSSRAGIVLGIGDGSARRRIAALVDAELPLERWTRVIHPSAVIGSSVEIAPGSMLIGQMSLTADIVIGKHVLINPGCTIAHDCVIGDFASVSPSVAMAGGVEIGEGAFLGTGAIVGPKVRVGAGAVIGAGSVVLNDIPAGERVHGVPARSRGRVLDSDKRLG